MKNLLTLPDNLPIPVDDGACDHLEGMKFPELNIPSTNGREINLGVDKGISVIYFYPMMGSPNSAPMIGWNDIPGARGCTPQSCEFKNHFSELTELGVKNVFGASSQDIYQQKETCARLHLPFELLNDSEFELANALNLPTFCYKDKKLIKRLTIIVEDGTILKVFYPVFPPNENAERVIEWLSKKKGLQWQSRRT